MFGRLFIESQSQVQELFSRTDGSEPSDPMCGEQQWKGEAAPLMKVLENSAQRFAARIIKAGAGKNENGKQPGHEDAGEAIETRAPTDAHVMTPHKTKKNRQQWI